mgnify:CR=1 FL=1
MKEKLLKNRKLIDIFIIILVGFLIGIPLLSKSLDVYIDDGVQHIARAYGTLESIKKDGVFPNIISSFANNFGYINSVFNNRFPDILLAITNLVFKNPIASFKLLEVITLFISGITMYCLVKEISENRNIGILAAGIYMMLPYHLTEIYVRNAFSEHLALAILPITFLGLYSLKNNERKHYLFPISLALMFMCDRSLSWIVFGISIIYLLVNIKEIKNNKILSKVILSFAFILILTACIWLPYFETTIGEDYKINNVTNEEIQGFSRQTISIRKLFVTAQKENYVFEVGPLLIAMFALTPMAFVKLKNEYKKDYITYLIFCILGFICATSIFSINIFARIFIKLQFPWRILTLANFFLTIVCAINMGAIVGNLKLKDSLILLVVSMAYIICLSGHIQNTENLTDIKNIELGNISGKVDEISAGINKAEYLPTKAYYNKFYIATRIQEMCVLEGKALIENENKNKNGSEYSAKVKTFEEQTKFELPYIYYPGYVVKEDGITLESIETENGFLGFVLGANDDAKIEVTYQKTNLEQIANIISIISVIAFVIYAVGVNKEENSK